jgi:hypothetical protein
MMKTQIDLDEIQLSNNDDTFYTFNVMDYVFLMKEQGSNEILNDDCENISPLVLSSLHAISNDIDSNEESKQLVKMYRDSIKLFGTA